MKNRRIRELCQKLFKTKPEGVPIRCAECSYEYDRGGFLYRFRYRFLDHACLHLGKDIFNCSYCDASFPSNATMGLHLRNRHSLGGDNRNYVDISITYEKDIMDMLERCFGQA